MPSNEQRREAAKRKLERQLERRAQRAQRRRVLTVAGAVLAVVLVGGGIVGVYLYNRDDDDAAAADATTSTTSPEPDAPADLPAPNPRPASVTCAYPPTPQQPSARPVTPPRTDPVGTSPATVSMSITTSQGPIGVNLDNAHAPCTVSSFVSLAAQGYFDNTPCHRLTTQGIKVLQCGDPTGTGTGGPGYQFANEYPTDQVDPTSAEAGRPANYKRGLIAMANAGPGTNGSQFFLVYGDSPLKPDYTVFGTIDDTGLATLDKVAAAGLADGDTSGDGKPAANVIIQGARLDN
ncbi:peptidylprolyl isomerase [Skermania piniformis]|uniref:Peptidyl-prolyl cis-trans isomerase n=1 Tax=Skermania pinensis TaxID=39122 RepID=A0ABX8SC19_9ACTN|nr:peptidylprolyl isomerase [Skermania piniformis]QXQ15430.1 peptidylprolyl isomerase [Skermania piniformis]